MNRLAKITVAHLKTEGRSLDNPGTRVFRVLEIRNSLRFIPGDEIREPELAEMVEQPGIWDVLIVPMPKGG